MWPPMTLAQIRVHELPSARRMRRVRTASARRRVVGRELARAVSGWGYRLSARFARSYAHLASTLFSLAIYLLRDYDPVT